MFIPNQDINWFSHARETMREIKSYCNCNSGELAFVPKTVLIAERPCGYSSDGRESSTVQTAALV